MSQGHLLTLSTSFHGLPVAKNIFSLSDMSINRRHRKQCRAYTVNLMRGNIASRRRTLFERPAGCLIIPSTTYAMSMSKYTDTPFDSSSPLLTPRHVGRCRMLPRQSSTSTHEAPRLHQVALARTRRHPFERKLHSRQRKAHYT